MHHNHADHDGHDMVIMVMVMVIGHPCVRHLRGICATINDADHDDHDDDSKGHDDDNLARISGFDTQ